ncbi:MAG: hypothetical protein WDO56_15340 [Gammaproteobacteria bacterium]
MRGITSLIRELSWVMPLGMLGLMALVLLRPWPVLSAPADYGTVVTDARGVAVSLPLPPRGVAHAFLRSFVQKTHAPHLLLNCGRVKDRRDFRGSVAGWLYPQLVENDRCWNADSDLESLLAHDTPGAVYFGDIWFSGTMFDTASLRSLGLTAMATRSVAAEEPEEAMFTEIRTLNAALGQSKLAESLIDAYRESLARLAQVLRPDTVPLQEWPRMMGLGAPHDDWSRLFVTRGSDPRIAIREAVGGNQASGREQDAERVLAMDPDIIVLLVSDPAGFYRDPRWRGLTAVSDHRVYANNPAFHGYVHDLDNLPLSARWKAEIAHPDRLQSSLREQIRTRYRETYGYEMSDEHIDELLRMQENADSAGYARFARKQIAP